MIVGHLIFDLVVVITVMVTVMVTAMDISKVCMGPIIANANGVIMAVLICLLNPPLTTMTVITSQLAWVPLGGVAVL